MTAILYLIPICLVMALGALVGFIWTLKTGQYEDLEGDAARMLEAEDRPLVPRGRDRL